MKKIILVAFVVALTGCQDKVKVAECWSAGTKASIESMGKSVALKKIQEMLDADIKPGDKVDAQARQKQMDAVEKMLTFTASEYYVRSVDAVSGSFHCSANAGLSYLEQGGGKVEADGSTFDFDINTGESGPVYVINRAPIWLMVKDLDEALQSAAKSK